MKNIFILLLFPALCFSQQTDSIVVKVAAGTTSTLPTELLIGTTIGKSIFTLPNPSAIRYLKINADNTVSVRTAGEMLGDLGAAASSHNHQINEVTSLQTALDGKASASHAHAISDVTNLQTSLNAKASLTGSEYITGKTFGAFNSATDASANDSYSITLNPAPSAYTTGMVIIFRAQTANTGAASINVNGLGVKTIVKRVNTTLANGDIPALQWCMLVYDGVNFVLLNPVVN